MYYVYIIRSISHHKQIYIGKTSNLKKRLSDHNCGNSAHTKKYVPWKLILFIGFEDHMKALDFEKYLKTGSGKAFRDKRLIS
jgi:putative endonuclease